MVTRARRPLVIGCCTQTTAQQAGSMRDPHPRAAAPAGEPRIRQGWSRAQTRQSNRRLDRRGAVPRAGIPAAAIAGADSPSRQNVIGHP